MRDDLRFRICPPFFSLRGMRVDSPTSNNHDAYERDTTFFKINPHRRSILRPAFIDEFDIDIELGQWIQLPTLHCIVNQLSTGVHLLTPVYRGKPFFREVTTDSEVAMIVAEMASRGGINRPEFEQFEQAHNARLKLDTTAVPKVSN
jgi:hypothetical protein